MNLTTSNVTINTEANDGDEIEETQNVALHSSESSRAPKRKKNENDNVERELIEILNRNLDKKILKTMKILFFSYLW